MAPTICLAPKTKILESSLTTLLHSPSYKYLSGILWKYYKYCFRLSQAMRWVTQILWFPSAYKTYIVDQVCNSIMSKKCVHLNLKILLKSSNHHLSLQQVVCCWRVLPQCWCCWLIRVVVVEGWEQKWGLPYWMIFPFMINFSIALNAI